MHLSIFSQVEICLVQLIMQLVEGGCLATHTLPIYIRYCYKIMYIMLNVGAYPLVPL